MEKKERLKINKLISKMKYKAYELKESGSIPTFLFEKICGLGVDSPQTQVNFLKDMTYKSLRIKGFYLRFPEESEKVKEEIEKVYKERGYK